MQNDVSLNLADLSFYRLKLYANLAIATAANSVGIWLILYASPKHIRVYRWFLLDILLSAFCMDFYMLTILQPLLLLPVPGYCPLGIVHFAGTFFGGYIGLLILFFFLGCCAASALSAAAFRLLSVFNVHHKLMSPWGFWSILALHLFISTPFQVIAGFVISEISGERQEAIRAKMAQAHLSIKEILASNQLCVFAPIEFAEVQAAVYIAIGILVIVGLVGIGIIFIGFYSLVRRKFKYSNRLYQMHMQLSLSLIGQLMVPGITLYIPFFVVALSFFFNLPFIQDLTQIYMMTFSMHSTLNALAMILFTKPYRQTILKWICRIKWVERLLRPFMTKKIVPKNGPAPMTIAIATERVDGKNPMEMPGMRKVMVKAKNMEEGLEGNAMPNRRETARKGGRNGEEKIGGQLKARASGRQSVPIMLVG